MNILTLAGMAEHSLKISRSICVVGSPQPLPLSGLLCCAFSQDKAAVSAAEAACWPRDVGFKATGGDESQHPTPTRENGKALIYV